MSTKMQVQCPTCQTVLNAPASMAGTTASCPRCQSAIEVPPRLGNGRNSQARLQPVILAGEDEAHHQGRGSWTKLLVTAVVATSATTLLIFFLVPEGTFTKIKSAIEVPLSVVTTTSGTREAKELLEAGKYAQAKAVLTKEIQADSNNADLHFLMGLCCLEANEAPEAQISFNKALRLDPKKSVSIGNAYYTKAKDALAATAYVQALDLFTSAKKYEPALGTSISSDITGAAISIMEVGDLKQAYAMFVEASKLSGSGNASAIASQVSPAIASYLEEALPHQGGMDSDLGKLAEFCAQLDAQYSAPLAKLYLDWLAEAVPETGGSNPDLSYPVELCLRLDPQLKDEVAQLYFAYGKALLESNEQEIERAISNGFNPAIALDRAVTQEVALFLRSLVARTSSVSTAIKAARTAYAFDKQQGIQVLTLLFATAQKAYQAGEVEDFKKAMEAAEGMNIQPVGSERDRLLKALYKYETNNRLQALEELRALRSSADEFVSSTADTILSPPTAGRHDVNQSTVLSDISITLTHYEVTGNKMTCHFVIANLTDSKERLSIGLGESRSYIVDDNGSKLMSIPSIEEQRAADRNRSYRLDLSPRQSIEGKITFPLPSEGARKFTIFSLGGWPEWRIEDVPLK